MAMIQNLPANPIAGSVADQILTLMGLDREKQIYAELPSRLAEAREHRRQAQEALRQAKVNLEKYQDDLALQDGILMAEVTEELDEKGKARYSNESARKAAVLRLRAISNDYKAAKAAHDIAADCVARAEAALMEAEDTVKNLAEQFRAIETVLDVARGEMTVIAKFGGEHA